MAGAHTIPQNDVEKNNMLAFQNAFSVFGLEEAKDTIDREGSAKIKQLAKRLIDVVRTSDLSTKGNVLKLVEAWSISLNAVSWADRVRYYFAEKKDVLRICAVKYLHENQMIIVVEDMASDSILDYNMFAFQVRKEYPELYDFMVIDASAYEFMKNEFEIINEVYIRGE